MIPRKVAWEVLQAVSAGAYSGKALDRSLRKYSLNKSDKALATELTYGVIRSSNLLDHWIDFLGKFPAKKQPPLLRILLQLGLYQLLFTERIPSSAAINTTVEIAKTSELRRLSDVVNGLLRSADRCLSKGKQPPLPDSFAESCSIQYSLPLWIINKLIDDYGTDIALEFAIASNKPPTNDLRVNCLRSTPTEMIKKFSTYGISSKLIEGLDSGLEIESGLGDLQDWPGYEEGEWCVQDRSSQWIVPLLDPKPGDQVLDACSAPGSKTTHIAETIGNNGEIWAIDKFSSRLRLVSDNAKRMGVNNIKTFKADSSNLLTLKPEWQGYFDKILIDAPCSGLGTLARNPDIRWRMSKEKIKDLECLQSSLLEGLSPLLKSRGRIVYSTCTVNPDENLGCVKKYLSKNKDLKLAYHKQILPSSSTNGDGFFAAILDKD